MYYTGEGGGNDMRECPDGNRNANISRAREIQNGVNRCFTQRGYEGHGTIDANVPGAQPDLSDTT